MYYIRTCYLRRNTSSQNIAPTRAGETVGTKLSFKLEETLHPRARGGCCAIGGSSAGGNLAASLAIRHRDRGDQKLNGQILVYPCVDASMSMSDAAPHGQGYQLTSAMMADYLHAYCGNEADKRQAGLSPLFAADLSGLPKTLLLIAQLDPLAPEGIAYARRLEAAGVDVRLHVYDGVMHGFFAQAGVLSEARAAQLEVAKFLRNTPGPSKNVQ